MEPITFQITVQVNPEKFWELNKKCIENTAGHVSAHDVLHHSAVKGMEDAGFSICHATTVETKTEEA